MYINNVNHNFVWNLCGMVPRDSPYISLEITAELILVSPLPGLNVCMLNYSILKNITMAFE